MSEIKVFENPEFGKIRTLTIDGEPWFVGKDVAERLGYADANKAVAMHVDEEDKLNDKTASSLGQRGGWFINESGLYSLVLSSKLPTAKAFKRWVTSDVIPSIRKNGGYIAGQEKMTDMEILAHAVLVAQNVIKSKEKEIESLQNRVLEMQPKADYYDQILQCKDAMSISAIAKDYGFSAMKMNRTLKNLHIQYKQGDVWLLYQKHAGNGYTQTRTNLYTDENGQDHVRVWTYWTQKGRLFLYELLKQNGILPMIEREEM